MGGACGAVASLWPRCTLSPPPPPPPLFSPSPPPPPPPPFRTLSNHPPLPAPGSAETDIQDTAQLPLPSCEPPGPPRGPRERRTACCACSINLAPIALSAVRTAAFPRGGSAVPAVERAGQEAPARPRRGCAAGRYPRRRPREPPRGPRVSWPRGPRWTAPGASHGQTPRVPPGPRSLEAGGCAAGEPGRRRERYPGRPRCRARQLLRLAPALTPHTRTIVPP